LRLEKQLHGRTAIKLLVGTKLDEETTLIDQAGLDNLKDACDCLDYLPTSAKVSRGIDALRAAIAQAINWSELSQTTRPLLFQHIRDVVDARQRNGEVVLLYADLEKQLRDADPQQFDPRAVNTVVEQLRMQGVIAESRLETGQRVLIQQIGYIEQYAGSLIVAARQNPRGMPALEETAVAAGRMMLPGLKAEERLHPFQEPIVLQCVIQLLLEHGICLKHEGLLIFPALFPSAVREEDTNVAHTVSLYYDFSGAIDNIYSSLVVRLALGERFGRVRLWKDGAEYEQPGQGMCGLRKVDRRSGLAHLDLFFSEHTASETRNLFMAFVEEHLQKEGVTIKEVLAMVCGTCGYHLEESLIRDRINLDYKDVLCPRCETRLPISEGAKKARADNPQVEQELFALRTKIEQKTQADVGEVKQAFKPMKVFLSYSHRDDVLRNELVKHLSILRREGIIDTWHDRLIGAGTEWKNAIDRQLEAAGLILLLVSADFLASDYCYDIEMKRAMQKHDTGEARVIPVILREVDWQGAPFGRLQALPRDARPVTSWAHHDEAFANIARGIRAAIAQQLRPEATVAEPVADEAGQLVTVWEPLAQPPIRILHLSDLHFPAHADPMSLWQPLVADLKDREGGLGFERLDYLVISGDLTNTADSREFETAFQFISELNKRFALSAQRCIIVPGNHDLSWDVEVYDWQPKRRVDLPRLQPGSYIEQGDGFLVREDARYAARFDNFRAFYHSLIQQPYPRDAREQCLAFLFEEAKIQFLTLNSAWEIDEYYRQRSGINDSALSVGLAAADEQIDKAKAERRLAQDDHMLRIAVWQHPATGNEKISHDAFLARLQQANFTLCLHGHVHEDRADLLGYLHPTRKLYIAGSGSFGAPTSARPESTPRLYNVIEIWRDHSKIRVHTRCLGKVAARGKVGRFGQCLRSQTRVAHTTTSSCLGKLRW
jgi:hypothetical protein